jgi:hypothetical protein
MGRQRRKRVSTKSRTLLRGLALAGASTVVIAGAAAPAQANFTKTLTYSCTYPYVGAQPLSVDIDADIPASLPSGTASAAYGIDAVATAGGSTSSAVSLIGASTIEGTTDAKSTVTSGAQSIPLDVPINVPAQAVAGSGDLVLNASGTTPPVTVDNPGTATITVDSIALTLIARGDDGLAIQLDPDASPVPQTDADPDTFQVSCALAPTTQDTTLATVNVT